MGTAEKLEEPDPHEGRLAHLSEAERLQPPSEEHDAAAGWEIEDGNGGTIRYIDRDPRPVVDPQPIDTPLTEVNSAMDFEKVAAVRIEPTDSAERIIELLRESGGVYTDEGEFSTGAYQLEMLLYALEDNAAAYEELPEDSGLRQWVDANCDSEEAVETFTQLYCIMHSKEDTPGGETPAEAIVNLVETTEEDVPEPSPPRPSPPPRPEPQPRLGKRVLRRLRPRLS